MAKEGLRRGRYSIIGMDAASFEEMCGLIRSRNNLFWLKGSFEDEEMQFDLNNLWFEMPFKVLRF